MKLPFLTFLALSAHITFAAQVIEVADRKGAVLHRIVESDEIQRISTIFRNPDSPYTPESKTPDPFSLPEELVILIFKEDQTTTARVGIMFYGSMVTYRKKADEKFPGSIGVNSKLTEWVIDLIENGTLPPDSILTPQLRIDNIREKSKIEKQPNQSLQRTSTAVTDRAAHAPRQLLRSLT